MAEETVVEDKVEVATVEVEDKVEETKTDNSITVDEAKEMGLNESEISMGKEHGDIVDKKPDEKDTKNENEDKDDKDDKDKDTKPKEEDKPDKDTKAKKEDGKEDIDPEKEADAIKDYTPNEKAQYFMRKKERSKRQKADRKAELLEVKNQALRDKLKGFEKGDDKLDLDDELDKDLNNDNEPVTKGDLKKIEEKKGEQVEKAKAISASLDDRYADARVEDANFDKLCDLANEVMKEDAKEGGIYAVKLIKLAEDEEGDIAGYIKKLAKLHDKYDEVGKEADTTDKDTKKETDQIITNATKRTSSASVSSGSGRRIVSEADLTIEDAAILSDDAWGKLKPETRERILRATSG